MGAPRVEVYHLDHETKHCLFLKERGGVTRMYKPANKWCTSEEECKRLCREHIDHVIKKLEEKLATMRAIESSPCHRVPPIPTIRDERLKV
jgi:hypothetical protein